MSEKEDLINLFCSLPSTVEPPPLGRIVFYVGFNQLSKFGSVLEDIVLPIFSTIKLEWLFYNELMVV